jgi:hypothetical protein
VEQLPREIILQHFLFSQTKQEHFFTAEIVEIEQQQQQQIVEQLPLHGH